MKIVRIPMYKEKQQTSLNPKLDTDPFADIFKIVATITNPAYWLLESAIIYQDWKIDTVDIVSTNIEELALCHSEEYEAFLLSYSRMRIIAPYVAGDWTNVIGLKQTINCEEYDLYKEMEAENIKVLLQCIDGLCWDVYTFNKKIEDKLLKFFSNATLLQIDEIMF